MKVILYMAPTVNGLIAKANNETNFVSKTEWKAFNTMINKCGNIVIGRKTYDILAKENLLPPKKIKLFVLTRNLSFKSKEENVRITSQSPKEIIKSLQKEGFKEILIAGGGKTNSGFLKEKLIDEIYLDIEPIIVENGVPLFAENNFEAKLKLIGTKKLSPDEIQLHYKVIK